MVAVEVEVFREGKREGSADVVVVVGVTESMVDRVDATDHRSKHRGTGTLATEEVGSTRGRGWRPGLRPCRTDRLQVPNSNHSSWVA